MRAQYYTIALSLFLLFSLTACGMGDQKAEDADSTASSRSALERDGVHDGRVPATPLPEDPLLGESYIQSTPNQGNHAANPTKPGNDLKNPGDQMQEGFADTGRDLANGLLDAANRIK